MPTFLYAHDLDGSPADLLPRLLKGAVVAPDGRFRGLARRVDDLRVALAAHPGATVIGVGYGALAALVVAVERPADVHHLVLLGPALEWSEPPLYDAATLALPPSLPVTVFHGTDDSVTPIPAALRFAGRWPRVRLVVLDDVHDLRATLPEVAKTVQSLARTPAPPKPDPGTRDPARSERERAAAAARREAVKERARRAAARSRERAAAKRAAAKARELKRRAREQEATILRAAKAWGARTRKWGSRDPSLPMPEPPLPPPRIRVPGSTTTRWKVAPRRPPLVLARDGQQPGEGPSRWLRRWRPAAPDGHGRPFEERLRDLVAAVDQRPGCVLCADGDGARVALAALAARSVAGVLLLGPTLGPDDALGRSVPTVVVHGSGDAGLEASRAFVARHPRARLVVVDGDLRDAGPAIASALKDLQAAIASEA
jgi:hypothetical protein